MFRVLNDVTVVTEKTRRELSFALQCYRAIDSEPKQWPKRRISPHARQLLSNVSWHQHGLACCQMLAGEH